MGTQTGAQLGYNNEGELAVTRSGTTTTTLYVGDVEEVASIGGTTTTTAYYYAGGRRIGLSVNGTVSYLASDGLGSANVTLNGSGTATASQLYASYGGSRYSSGTMPTSYGFTGQRADTASGLDYYGARYYDPLAGQFTSADSELPGAGFDLLGLSRYAYVSGNPENRTDPTGHINLSVGDNGSAVPIDNAFQGTYSWGGGAVGYNRGFIQAYPAALSVAQRISMPQAPKPPDLGRIARQAVGQEIYANRVINPFVDYLWPHPDLDPTGGYWLARLSVQGTNLTDPKALMLVAGLASGGGEGSFALDRNGRLTDGNYTVNDSAMTRHMPATAGPDRSVFLSGVDAHKAVLDAARFADAHGLWDAQNKAKVWVINGPVGVVKSSGLRTSWINVYRRASGLIHGSPGTPPT